MHLGDCQNLEVFVRYLVGTKNYGNVSKLAHGLDHCDPLPLHAYIGSDQEGCEVTRKSNSGRRIVLAGTVVETNSTTQPRVPATSSREAEVRSLTLCTRFKKILV